MNKPFPAAPLIACHFSMPAILSPFSFHSHCFLFLQFVPAGPFPSPSVLHLSLSASMPRPPESSVLNYLTQIKAQQQYHVLSLPKCQIHFSFFLSLHCHHNHHPSLSAFLTLSLLPMPRPALGQAPFTEQQGPSV